MSCLESLTKPRCQQEWGVPPGFQPAHGAAKRCRVLLGVLTAYPNNPAARKAIRPQAKCKNAR